METSNSSIPPVQPIWSDEAFEDCLRSCPKSPSTDLPRLIDRFQADQRSVPQVTHPTPDFSEVLCLIFYAFIVAGMFLAYLAAGSLTFPLGWWLHVMDREE